MSLLNEKEEGNDTKDRIKDRVKVFIRFRPSFDKHGLPFDITPDNRQLHIADAKGNHEKDRWYNFDYIFPTLSSNKQVYKIVGHQLVDAALNGINTSLFAYGQTGSGKTHTLMSKDGLTAHMISLLFSKIWNDCYHDYKVTCSYMQIYQERLYDLLNPNANLELRIREDPVKGPFIENIASFVCNTPTDVYHLLNVGRRRLVFAETKMNRLSSRSHAICQIHIEKKKKVMQNAVEGRVPVSNTPVEISSPRADQRPMPELNEQEFETIPFVPTTLKKRHSIAVSMPTKRNSASNLTMNKKLRLNPSNSRLSSPREPYFQSVNKRHSVQLTRAVSVNEKSPSIKLENKSCLSASSSFRHETPTNALNRLNIRRSSRPDTADIASFLERRPETPDPLSYDTLMHSNTSLASSRLSNSTDSVIDDMQWQINASTADISKIFERESSSQELLDLSFRDTTTEETNFDKSEDQEEFTQPFTGSNMAENFLLKGKMSIVDLAGSERLKKSQAEGERLAETQNINSSLLELGNVVSALADGNRTHVPYRNSLLTRLLQDSIGGNCKTSFVLCTSSAMEDLSETKCTLEFGKRLLMISTKPKQNIETDYKKLCDELKLNIKELEDAKERDIKGLYDKLKNLEATLASFKEDQFTQNIEIENLHKNLELKKTQNENLIEEISALNTKLQNSEKLLSSTKEKNIELKNQIHNLNNHKSNMKHVETNTEQLLSRDVAHVETNTEQLLSRDVSSSTTRNQEKIFTDSQTSPLHSLLQNINTPLTSCSEKSFGNTEKLSDNTEKLSDNKITTEYAIGLTNNQVKCRVKQMLITELMSLQLLYSMLELNFNRNIRQPNEDKDRHSPISSKSSGYLTGSQGHLDCDRFSNNVLKNHDFTLGNTVMESPLLARLQSCSSNKGSLLEEIIETQLQKNDENPAMERDRITSLKKEIVEHKSVIDDQLQTWLSECTLSEDNSSKKDLYTKLVLHLTSNSSESNESLEKLEQLLDLILVDHSLTGCLLALSNPRKSKREDNMMRRLSSIKTNPKSLLDFIDIDAEFHGYENEAAVFHDDDEDMTDIPRLDDAPDTPEIVPKRNDVILDGIPTDSDEASDVENDFIESPTTKKKGIRKFLCMPVKSRKQTLKKFRPFSKKEKLKDSGSNLLQSED